MAQGHDAHAVLVGIQTMDDVNGGLVDVRDGHGVTYDFEWRYLDSTKPPGRDEVERRLWVVAKGGRFHATDMYHARVLRSPSAAHPRLAPRCPARDAWKAAVRNGLPENAVVSMRWELRSDAWEFRVKGHPEMTRAVSASTCSVGGKQSGPTPPAPSAGPCGCRKGDLMCVMKCNEGKK